MKKVNILAALALSLGVVSISALGQQLGNFVFIPLAGNPHDVVYDAARNLAYVSNRSLDRVDIISLDTNTVQSSIPVGDMPMGLAITPDFSQLLVTLYTPRQMAVVDLNTRLLNRTISLPLGISRNYPLRVDFDAAGTCIWRDGGPAGAYGYVYILNLGTNISTRLFTNQAELRYAYSEDRSKFIFLFNNPQVSIWNAATQTASTPHPMPDFGTSWSDWLTQGTINNSGTRMLLSKGGYETRVYDQNFTYLGSTTPMAWGTFGPWENIAIIVEAKGNETASDRITLIDVDGLSAIESLQLSQSIGINEYNYGSNPIALTNDAQSFLVVGQTGLFVIDINYPNLVSLEILGPDQVAENSTMKFRAIAHYDNNTTRDVSSSVSWNLTPADVATIDQNGNLTTPDLEKFRNVTITAEYTRQNVPVEATKSVTLYAICPTGSALRFDGINDYVQAGTIPALRVNDDFTWSFWVWLPLGNSADDIILGNRKSFTSNHFIKFSPTRFEYYSGSPDGTMTYNIPTERWVHIAVVKKGAVLTYYGNGNVVATKTITRDITDNPLYFGGDPKNPYGQSEFGACILDEVRIYSLALSAQQIQETMHISLIGDEPGLVGYWNFDEGQGQVVNDLSGHGNNGTLGTDPQAADAADPTWVDSDAPVGVCTPYLIATRALRRALDHKQQSLAQIESALEQEQTALDAIDEMLATRDLGDLQWPDVIKAKADVAFAVMQEKLSQAALNRSVERLQDALVSLGAEPKPLPQTPGFGHPLFNRADLNQDGVVDMLDFTIFQENWLK